MPIEFPRFAASTQSEGAWPSERLGFFGLCSGCYTIFIEFQNKSFEFRRFSMSSIEFQRISAGPYPRGTMPIEWRLAPPFAAGTQSGGARPSERLGLWAFE